LSAIAASGVNADFECFCRVFQSFYTEQNLTTDKNDYTEKYLIAQEAKDRGA
jgi:hypothetical protein